MTYIYIYIYIYHPIKKWL